MKIIHAVLALLLSALLLAIVAGAANASVAGVPIQAGQVPATAAVTHRDVSTPSTYSASPMATKVPMGTIKPSVTVMPTKVKRYNKVGGGELRIKPSATTKYVQLLGRKPTPVPTAKVTASPAPANRVAAPFKTPAQSYGISGLGGVTPYFNKTTPTSLAPRTSTAGTGGMVPLWSDKRYAGRGPGFGGGPAVQTTGAPAIATPRPIPNISINPNVSPTPVPGWYTPRFPGEPGYKGSPTPTVKATVTARPTAVRR